jgi:uncharacterized protein with ATP-grasp and redox domains
MKTYLECIPCFLKQALTASRLCGADDTLQKQIMDEVCVLVPEISPDATPPEYSAKIYEKLYAHLGDADPYREIKKESNSKALQLYPQLKTIVAESNNPLLTAVELAVAGNIIDYGAIHGLDVDTELEQIIGNAHESIEHESEQLFNFPAFTEALEKARSILYLGDNAGEIVFDRVLIEEIRNQTDIGEIYFAVRGKPIVNDVLYEDAVQTGVDKIATVISTGSGVPGVFLSQCTSEFRDIFSSADVVISKGQGNYESVSEIERTVFFLLRAKCEIIARDLACNQGDIILYKH